MEGWEESKFADDDAAGRANRELSSAESSLEWAGNVPRQGGNRSRKRIYLEGHYRGR